LLDEFVNDGIGVQVVSKNFRLDPTLPPRLAWIFRQRGVDVVHTHNPPPLVYAGIAARSMGAALVHTKHGVNHDLGRRIWLRKMAGQLVHGLVAVSEDTADHAIRQGEADGGCVQVISNGVDTDLYRPRAEARRALRSELGLSDETWVVGSIGRLVPEKNYASLLRAVAPLIRDGHVRLVLVGDGPEKESLRLLCRQLRIEDGVMMLGIRQDGHLLLSAMDAFALSSRTEGLPLALLEAMASELPVVATRVGGIPALLEGTDAGFLVPPGDEDALRAEIDRLRRDPEGARQVGKRARRLVVRQYGLDVVVEKTNAMYATALQIARSSMVRRVLRATAVVS
jgi:glycosyltransferase involved in cell wall biosynthesis